VTAAVIARWTHSSLVLTGWGWFIVGYNRANITCAHGAYGKREAV
jgi:hypothetical protein